MGPTHNNQNGPGEALKRGSRLKSQHQIQKDFKFAIEWTDFVFRGPRKTSKRNPR